MVKFGIISEVDLSKGLARVHFQDDEIVSHWLPMMVPKTKVDKFSLPFDVNEHVACLMDDGCLTGVILGAIYDEKNAPAITGRKVGAKFADNLSVYYDRASATLSILGDADINIQVTGDATIKCANADIEATGDATVKAATKVTLDAPIVEATATFKAGAIQITGASGASSVTGDVTVSGSITGAQVKQGTIELGTHRHTGVQTGGGTSGTPI